MDGALLMRGIIVEGDEVGERSRMKTIEIMAPDYAALATQIGELVTAKQAQYGDAFSVAPKILALLYPDGVQPTDYDTLLAVVRILDKLKRVATQHESDTEDAWADIMGYALLMRAKRERTP